MSWLRVFVPIKLFTTLLQKQNQTHRINKGSTVCATIRCLVLLIGDTDSLGITFIFLFTVLGFYTRTGWGQTQTDTQSLYMNKYGVLEAN